MATIPDHSKACVASNDDKGNGDDGGVTGGISKRVVDDAGRFYPEMLGRIVAGEKDDYAVAKEFIECSKSKPEQLEPIFQQLGDVLKTITNMPQAEPIFELRASIKQFLLSPVPLRPPELHASERIEDVRFLVEEQPLLHTFDLTRFTDRVVELFTWHKDQAMRDEFIAPYFSLVQSSGMGKTKLLFEFRKLVEDQKDERILGLQCRTILCEDAVSSSVRSNKSDPIFSDTIVVPEEKKFTWETVFGQLDAILKNCKATKVVFLFDEAHRLLGSDGSCFRTVRWWLRSKKRPIDVVAVFTGTTLRLTNFHAEPPTERSGATRDGSRLFHANGRILYAPFYDICTVGLFAFESETETTIATRTETPSSQSSQSTVGTASATLTDYEKAIPHGRPLFALMLRKGPLDDKRMFNILTRIMSKPDLDQDWRMSPEVCLSILGTRIQMGQTTFPLTSDLVSKGCALLTYYSVLPSMTTQDNNTARLSFPTDPVCAHLAMCMMDEDWSISYGGCTISAESKNFWVSKMLEIFSTGLCFPNQGNIGELAGALYLLFCGDVLRKGKDPEYKTFSVSLSEFVKCTVRPHEYCKSPPIETDDESLERKPTAQKRAGSFEEDVGQSQRTPPKKLRRLSRRLGEPKPLYKDAQVSFIQVVANYLRDGDITDQGILRNMFESGCAYYAYSMCHDINMVGSIRLIDFDSDEHYVPLLVSISTVRDKGSQKYKLDRMTKMLSDKQKFGFCIRLLFAHPDDNGHEMQDIMTESDVNDLLCSKTVSKVVIVPHDDPFGLVAVLLETASLSPPICEVYSSQYFMQLKDYTPKSIVRKNHSSDLLKYVTGLLKAITGFKKETNASDIAA